ncbi:hypothetical protein DSM19430T_16520 [Desulfovibrio psychrotolerans]|uniref:Transglycosylase SLT domain-containing protein n=2 Tax=Desulfovibrio psychrotolerans TaxID=415242 RepID=A0A7J0BTH5_9BACT|nr:hypothetical protein DSM19430T_16520 [Desulfovibrio psychrotolerans]
MEGQADDAATVAAVASRLAEEGADAATVRMPVSSISAPQGHSGSDKGPQSGLQSGPRFLVAGTSTAGIVFTEPGSGADPASGDDTDGVARRLAAMLSWQPLVDRLVADGFDRGSLNDLFYRMGHAYSPHAMGHKMRALFRRKFYPPPPLPPGEPAPAPAVYEWVLEEATLQRARDFMQEHDALLRGAEARFGVPKEVAVGLLLVETRLGTYLGKEMALRNLASLAATDSLVLLAPEMEGLTMTPDRSQWLEVRMGQKSRWAYAELKALLSHAADNEVDPVSMPGSVYGAIGICQFMPSNIPHYGVDGDGDGRVDLFNLHDAVHSLAHFLKSHGWKKGMDRAGQHSVLKRYNNSNIYANSILAVADALRQKAANP